MKFGFGADDNLGKIDFWLLPEAITKEELSISNNSFAESLFTLIDSDYEKGRLSREELSLFWGGLKSAAGDDNELSDAELLRYIEQQESIKNVNINVFKNFILNLANKANDKITVAQIPPEVAQRTFIEECFNIEDQARAIYSEINLGEVSDLVEDEALKNDRSQFARELDFISTSNKLMQSAISENLTLKEYVEIRREHLILKMVNYLLQDSWLDSVKVTNYCERLTMRMSPDELVEFSRNLALMDDECFERFIDAVRMEIISGGELWFVDNDNADAFPNVMSAAFNLPDVVMEKSYDAEALMPFEQVFYYEQGISYNNYAFSDLTYKQNVLSVVLNAHNQLQGLKIDLAPLIENEGHREFKFKHAVHRTDNARPLGFNRPVNQEDFYTITVRKSDDASVEENLEVLNKVMERYYGQHPDPMEFKEEIDKILQEKCNYYHGLVCEVDENNKIKFRFAHSSPNQLKVLTQLSEELIAYQEKNYEQVLQDRTLDSYLSDYEDAYNKAFSGTRILKDDLIANAIELTDRSYETVAELRADIAKGSLVGMGMIVIGGIVSFVPLPGARVVGGGMVKTGSTLAMGSTALDNIVNITEASTRDVVSGDELGAAFTKSRCRFVISCCWY